MAQTFGLKNGIPLFHFMKEKEKNGFGRTRCADALRAGDRRGAADLLYHGCRRRIAAECDLAALWCGNSHGFYYDSDYWQPMGSCCGTLRNSDIEICNSDAAADPDQQAAAAYICAGEFQRYSGIFGSSRCCNDDFRHLCDACTARSGGTCAGNLYI